MKPLGYIAIVVVSVGTFVLLFSLLNGGSRQKRDGFPYSTSTFEMPADMCYNINDQSPMIVNSTRSDQEYTFSYINTSGDLVSKVWMYRIFADWEIIDPVIAKGHLKPKCFTPPYSQ